MRPRVRGWAKKLPPETVDLLIALAHDRHKAVEEALRAGADVNATRPDRDNASVLQLACTHAEPDCLNVVLGGDTKPDFVPDARGRTAQHECARYTTNNLALPLLVLAFGFCRDTDADGRNVLHDLMRNEAISDRTLNHVLDWLLRTQTTEVVAQMVNQRTSQGQTVLDVAVKRDPHRDPARLSEMHCCLLRIGARSGSDLDSTRRDQLQIAERTARTLLTDAEAGARADLKELRRKGKSTALKLQSIAERARQTWRREGIRRDDIQLEEKKERTALDFSFRVRQGEVRQMGAYLKDNHAALKIQSVWRRHRAKADVAVAREVYVRRSNAALDIQRVYRGHSVRRAFVQLRAQVTAVRFIQKLWRMFATRRRAREQRKKLMHSRQNAGVTILCAFRRIALAKRITARLIAQFKPTAEWVLSVNAAFEANARHLQAWWHGRSCRLHYVTLRGAALRCQKFFRTKRILRAQRVFNRRRIAVDRVAHYLKRERSLHLLREYVRRMLRKKLRLRLETSTRAVTRTVWRESFISYFYRHRSNFESMFFKERAPEDRTLLFVDSFLAVAAFVACLAALLSMCIVRRTTSTVLANNFDNMLIAMLWMRVLLSEKKVALLLDVAMLTIASTAAVLQVYPFVPCYTVLLLRVPLQLASYSERVRAIADTLLVALYLLSYWAVIGVVAVLAAAQSLVAMESRLDADGHIGHAVLRVLRDGETQRAVVQLSNATQVAQQLTHSVSMSFTAWVVLLLAVISSVCGAVHSVFKRYHANRTHVHLERWIVAEQPELVDKYPALAAERAARRAANAIAGESRRSAWIRQHPAAVASALKANKEELVPTLNAWHSPAIPAPLGGSFASPTRPVEEDPDAEPNTALSAASPGAFDNDAVLDWTYDCTQEHPQLQFDMDRNQTYATWHHDARIGVEDDTQRGDHPSALHRFVAREWEGGTFVRRGHVLVLAIVCIGLAFPKVSDNCSWERGTNSERCILEYTASAVLCAELLVYVLVQPGLAVKHKLSLLVRIGCVVVGFVPEAQGYGAIRAVRLLDGLHVYWRPFRLHLVGLAMCVYFTAVCWLVSVAALVQTYNNDDDRVASHDCETFGSCARAATMFLFLPPDTASDVQLVVAATTLFHGLIVPFCCAILAHPLLGLGDGVLCLALEAVKELQTRLRRQVEAWTETEAWFTGRRIRIALKPALFVRAKHWAQRAHQRWRNKLKRADELARPPSVVRDADGRSPSVETSSRRGVSPDQRDADDVPPLPMSTCHEGCIDVAPLLPPLLSGPIIRPARDVVERHLSHKALIPVWVKTNGLLQSPIVHLLHVAVSIVSIGLLFHRGYAGPARIVVYTVHWVSIGFALVVAPRDVTCIFTVGACVCLALAMHYPDDELLFLRFVSTLRVFTWQVRQFRTVFRAVRRCAAYVLRATPLLAGAVLFTFVIAQLAHASRAVVDTISEHLSLLWLVAARYLAPLFVVVCFYVGIRRSRLHHVPTAATALEHVVYLERPSEAMWWVRHAFVDATGRPKRRVKFARVFDGLATLLLLLNLAAICVIDVQAWGPFKWVELACAVVFVLHAALTIGAHSGLPAARPSDERSSNDGSGTKARNGDEAKPNEAAAHRAAQRDAMDGFAQRADPADNGTGSPVAMQRTGSATMEAHRPPPIEQPDTPQTPGWVADDAEEPIVDRVDEAARGIRLGFNTLAAFDLILCLVNFVAVLIVPVLATSVDPVFYTAVLSLRYLRLLRFMPRDISVGLLYNLPLLVGSACFMVLYVLVMSLMAAEATAENAADISTDDQWRFATLIVALTVCQRFPAAASSLFQSQPVAIVTAIILRVVIYGLIALLVLKMSEYWVLRAEGLTNRAAGLYRFMTTGSVPQPDTPPVEPAPEGTGGDGSNRPSGEAPAQPSPFSANGWMRNLPGTNRTGCSWQMLAGRDYVPRWQVRFLLEGLKLVHVAHQREFFQLLLSTAEFLAVRDERARVVAEVFRSVETMKAGGPDDSQVPRRLPSYPPRWLADEQGETHAVGLTAVVDFSPPKAHSPASAPRRRDTAADAAIAPEELNTIGAGPVVSTIRLVQALHIVDAGYPVHSAHDVRMWQAFLSAQRRVRAAVKLQSLWRMYASNDAVEWRLNRMQRETLVYLRSRARMLRDTLRVRLMKSATWSDALNRAPLVYNTSALHDDFCQRIRAKWESLATVEASPLSPLKRTSFDDQQWLAAVRRKQAEEVGVTPQRYALATTSDADVVAAVPQQPARYGRSASVMGQMDDDDDDSEVQPQLPSYHVAVDTDDEEDAELQNASMSRQSIGQRRGFQTLRLADNATPEVDHAELSLEHPQPATGVAAPSPLHMPKDTPFDASTAGESRHAPPTPSAPVRGSKSLAEIVRLPLPPTPQHNPLKPHHTRVGSEGAGALPPAGPGSSRHRMSPVRGLPPSSGRRTPSGERDDDDDDEDHSSSSSNH